MARGRAASFCFCHQVIRTRSPDGYTPLPSDTYSGFALLRSNLHSHSDAEAFCRGDHLWQATKIYPLSAAANPPETVFTDAKDVQYDSTMRYDLGFFRSLRPHRAERAWIKRCGRS